MEFSKLMKVNYLLVFSIATRSSVLIIHKSTHNVVITYRWITPCEREYFDTNRYSPTGNHQGADVEDSGTSTWHRRWLGWQPTPPRSSSASAVLQGGVWLDAAPRMVVPVDPHLRRSYKSTCVSGDHTSRPTPQGVVPDDCPHECATKRCIGSP